MGDVDKSIGGEALNGADPHSVAEWVKGWSRSSYGSSDPHSVAEWVKGWSRSSYGPSDPHSVAEWERRERFGQNLKALQELVPNANKTGKFVVIYADGQSIDAGLNN